MQKIYVKTPDNEVVERYPISLASLGPNQNYKFVTVREGSETIDSPFILIGTHLLSLYNDKMLKASEPEIECIKKALTCYSKYEKTPVLEFYRLIPLTVWQEDSDTIEDAPLYKIEEVEKMPQIVHSIGQDLRTIMAGAQALLVCLKRKENRHQAIRFDKLRLWEPFSNASDELAEFNRIWTLANQQGNYYNKVECEIEQATISLGKLASIVDFSTIAQYRHIVATQVKKFKELEENFVQKVHYVPPTLESSLNQEEQLTQVQTAYIALLPVENKDSNSLRYELYGHRKSGYNYLLKNAQLFEKPEQILEQLRYANPLICQVDIEFKSIYLATEHQSARETITAVLEKEQLKKFLTPELSAAQKVEYYEKLLSSLGHTDKILCAQPRGEKQEDSHHSNNSTAPQSREAQKRKI